MLSVTCVQHNGESETITAHIGDTLMEAARSQGIAGIVAQCGGSCACATCHVHIDDQWHARVGNPNEEEERMLECVVDLKPTSRLACQIELTESLNGLIVYIPAAE
jgi:2Fe-2S ferredoxin